jgi:hypothetical protein
VLAPGEGWLVKRHVADEVEGVKVLANFFGQRLKRQPYGAAIARSRLATLPAVIQHPGMFHLGRHDVALGGIGL